MRSHLENTQKKNRRYARGGDDDTAVLAKALKNTLELLGGAEQKESVSRFLRNEYGISLDGDQEIDEKTIASALSNLFGSGGELLLRMFRQEKARLRTQSKAKTKSSQHLAEFETRVS